MCSDYLQCSITSLLSIVVTTMSIIAITIAITYCHEDHYYDYESCYKGKGVGAKINSLSSSPTPFSPELTEPQALTDLRRYPWGLGGCGSLNHGTWPFRRVSGTQNLGLQTLRVQTESLCLKSAWHRATEKVFQLQSQLTGETRNFALEQEVT